MKKRALLFAVLFFLSLVACGGGNSTGGGDDEDYQYTPQDISARDVTVPTELPKMDEPSFQIHYRRNDNKYADWGLWLWDGSNPSGNDEKVDTFNYQDDFGVIGYYPFSYLGECPDGRAGFIIRKLASWSKDGATDSDAFVDKSTLTPDANNCYHVYVYSGDPHIYSNPNKAMADDITVCEFSDLNNIKVETTNKVTSYKLYKDELLIAEGVGVNSKSFTFALPSHHSEVVITSIYKFEATFLKSGKTISTTVSIANLYDSRIFNELNYDGDDLGATYSPTSTTFKVWSPVSSSIKLRIYDNGTPTAVDASKGSNEYTEHVMSRGEKGIFSITVNGDLAGKYYTYAVTNSKFVNTEIVDPYAKSAGVNGLRGQIVDFSKTNPTGWDSVTPHQIDRNALTVWETHVADVTSHSSWTGSEANRRKYLGMVEEGTTFTKNSVTVKTGFDHIKELGVNAVQLLPIFDQDNDETTYKFNWGYNPLNYNVVEGLYSSNPHDGYARIRELKTVIMEFNKAGINTIMDVVYNHVSNAGGSNFDVLMPGYYYRYVNGKLSNGSGCGNETASEMPMMRKFMIDSTKFWAKEYKLGGFRFDLMGLHDITTMNKLTEACKTINPGIVIYGEPWTGGTSAMKNFETNSAKQSNASKYKGYGQFNDQMRDALIKGGLNSDASQGWITDTKNIDAKDIAAIKDGIKGATTNAVEDPNKTVNYVTCHDNYTLIDRIKKSNPSVSSRTDFNKMAVLANAIVFTSQGTAFMLAGEEFLRSKNGDHNSYQSPDSVNQYKYELLITNASIYENYKALIKFKQDVADLHASTCKINVETLDGGAVLKYTVNNGNEQYVVIHCNGVGAKTSINLSEYNVYLDTLGLNEVGASLTASFVPSQYQTLIAKRA